MKYFNNVIIFSLIFCLRSSDAEIIKKEPYSIQPEINYKQNLNIALLSFSCELKQERKYIKDLIRNSIIDRILLYKKIRFSSSYPEFKRNKFTSLNNTSPDNDKSNEYLQPINDNNGFLEVKFLKTQFIDKIFKSIRPEHIKEIYNLNSQECISVPGPDIIIYGEINQDRNNIEVKIKVINTIYNEVFIIKKSGTFKNIDKLSESISFDIIKCLIVSYSFLNISCNEKEAIIYIDDRYFGRTDKTGLLLEAGTHKIAISVKNGVTKIIQLDLPEKASESLSVNFSANDFFPKQSVNIKTTPGNAKVYLDADFIGFSPVVKFSVADGTYRLRVEKDGYITQYRTIVISSDKKTADEFNIELEKGDSKEYYFERTSVYNILFKCSLWGAAISSASYVFFGMKVEDEKSKLRNLPASDPDYNKIEDQRDKYKLYRQISLYTIGAMIISAGVFYYLDIAQDDIAIAVHIPQNNYRNSFQLNNLSSYSSNNYFGLSITKSF